MRQGRPNHEHAGQLDWLLDDLVARVTHIDKAVILSRDGLAIGASGGLSREDAEYLSAVAAGFQSLARGAGQHFGGGAVRQTVVEMEQAFLFVTAAGEGSCLAVLAGAGVDAGTGRLRDGRAGQARRRAPGGQPAAGAALGRGRVIRGACRQTSQWVDQDAGPVVRPYALTGGRTRPAGERFDLLALVCAVRGAGRRTCSSSGPSSSTVLRRCQVPTPAADLASDLDLPLGVVRILVSDLRERGLVTIHQTGAGRADRY